MVRQVRSPNLYKLMSQGIVVRPTKNTTISSTSEGNDIMFVTQGYVKRYAIGNDGSLKVQIIYGPQDLFPLTRVFRTLLGQNIYDGPETFYYAAMADAQLYSLSLQAFMEAVQANSLLYKELFAEAGHHLKACVHSIENMSLHSTYARVAHQLLFVAREFGQETVDGIKFCAPITHQDIADVLGVTRATATLAVVKLREKGLVLPARPLIVRNLDQLAIEAYS